MRLEGARMHSVDSMLSPVLACVGRWDSAPASLELGWGRLRCGASRCVTVANESSSDDSCSRAV